MIYQWYHSVIPPQLIIHSISNLDKSEGKWESATIPSYFWNLIVAKIALKCKEIGQEGNGGLLGHLEKKKEKGKGFSKIYVPQVAKAGPG